MPTRTRAHCPEQRGWRAQPGPSADPTAPGPAARAPSAHQTARALAPLRFEEPQCIEMGVMGRGSPAERSRPAVFINGPSWQQEEGRKKKKLSGRKRK